VKGLAYCAPEVKECWPAQQVEKKSAIKILNCQKRGDDQRRGEQTIREQKRGDLSSKETALAWGRRSGRGGEKKQGHRGPGLCQPIQADDAKIIKKPAKKKKKPHPPKGAEARVVVGKGPCPNVPTGEGVMGERGGRSKTPAALQGTKRRPGQMEARGLIIAGGNGRGRRMESIHRTPSTTIKNSPLGEKVEPLNIEDRKTNRKEGYHPEEVQELATTRGKRGHGTGRKGQPEVSPCILR